ncbi:hypothetical protein D3C78_1806790 [compost metagenome]
MARVPSCLLTEVLTRMKSSPLRTNTVATPAVIALKSSTSLKLLFNTSLPRFKPGVCTPATVTGWSGCTLKPALKRFSNRPANR